MIGELRYASAVSVSWLGLALSAGSAPADYYLAPDGSDSNPGTQALPWRTVQHALDTVPASGGSTLWLEDGIYDGFFDVDMVFANPVWVQAIHPYRAKLVASTNHRVTRIETGNVGFEGLEFSGSPVAGQVSVIFMTDSASHCTFRNNFIHDSYDNDLVRVLVNCHDVTFEGNLFLFNGDPVGGAVGVRGCRNITLRANTVVGSPLNERFLGKVAKGDNNPVNEGILIANNILSHSTGNMQRLCESPWQDTAGGTIDNNLYWNAGSAIPVNPNDWFNHVEDAHGVVNDPDLADPLGAIVPRWTGGEIQGGYASIREAFVALVEAYAAIGLGSPAIDAADPGNMPVRDIRGTLRDAAPDIGAYEVQGDMPWKILELLLGPLPR